MQWKRLLRDAQLVQLQLLQPLPEACVHSTLQTAVYSCASKTAWRAWCAQDAAGGQHEGISIAAHLKCLKLQYRSICCHCALQPQKQ